VTIVFKKRTKKLLLVKAPAGDSATVQQTKVFCFFSSEKKALLAARAGGWRFAYPPYGA